MDGFQAAEMTQDYLLFGNTWPTMNRLQVEHARRPGEPLTGMASRLQVHGWKPSEILLNRRVAALSADDTIQLPARE